MSFLSNSMICSLLPTLYYQIPNSNGNILAIDFLDKSLYLLQLYIESFCCIQNGNFFPKKGLLEDNILELDQD